MKDIDDLKAAFAAFDGVRVAPLRALAAAALSPSAEAHLLSALIGPDQIAASWLVKALAEAAALDDAALTQAFAAFPELTEADAILHLLQTVQHAPGSARGLRPHLPALAGHPKLFIKVWAFDAYCRTARGAAERADAAERIQQGLTDRFASIRARARALAPEFGVELPPKS